MKVSTFDFNKGNAIDRNEVSKWHCQILEKLSNGSKSPISIASGNSMVIGEVIRYSHDPDRPVVKIIVITNGYQQYEYSDIEIKNNNHAI